MRRMTSQIRVRPRFGPGFHLRDPDNGVVVSQWPHGHTGEPSISGSDEADNPCEWRRHAAPFGGLS